MCSGDIFQVWVKNSNIIIFSAGLVQTSFLLEDLWVNEENAWFCEFVSECEFKVLKIYFKVG